MTQPSSFCSNQPVVGVIACIKPVGGQPFHAVAVKYVDAVIEGAGCLPLLLPALGKRLPVNEVLASIDGLMLTGSVSNVDPARYGGTLSGVPHFDPDRDDSVFRLIEAALAQSVPLFGICRGFQELNVAMGGTLCQEVHLKAGHLDHRSRDGDPLEKQYGPAHKLKLVEGSYLQTLLPGASRTEMMVNSLHGQGIERLGAGLVAEAYAEDGLIEAIRVEDATNFALAVQWHPEWLVTENPDSMALFETFGKACLQRNRRRNERPVAVAERGLK